MICFSIENVALGGLLTENYELKVGLTKGEAGFIVKY
jgi:hypothetical protein